MLKKFSKTIKRDRSSKQITPHSVVANYISVVRFRDGINIICKKLPTDSVNFLEIRRNKQTFGIHH